MYMYIISNNVMKLRCCDEKRKHLSFYQPYLSRPRPQIPHVFLILEDTREQLLKVLALASRLNVLALASRVKVLALAW